MLVCDRSLIDRPLGCYRVMVGIGQIGVGQRQIWHTSQRPCLDAVLIELLLGDERIVGHHRLPIHADEAFVAAGCFMMAVCICAAQHVVLFQLRKVKELV